jgi:hypothetical protein
MTPERDMAEQRLQRRIESHALEARSPSQNTA